VGPFDRVVGAQAAGASAIDGAPVVGVPRKCPASETAQWVEIDHCPPCVKHYGRHQARLVAAGHFTDAPVDSVYSSVVSFRGVRMVQLHGPDGIIISIILLTVRHSMMRLDNCRWWIPPESIPSELMVK
jgi:hypothetical protein